MTARLSVSGMSVRDDWQTAIDAYLLTQRAGGYPATTIAARRQHLQHLARRVSVGPFDIEGAQLLEYAGAQDWMPETRRGRRNTFLSFYRWAIATGRCSSNPALSLPRVKATQGVARPIPATAYQTALKRSDPRTALILRLAHDAGLRRGEIAQIHSDDLVQDLDGWSLLVHGKGQRQRVVPLTRRLALDLRARGEGWAFPGDFHGHLSPRRVGELAIAVLPDPWTLHTLRHSFATRVYSLEHDVYTVQDLLGHASSETTRRYVATDRSALRRSVVAAADAALMSS